MELPKGDLRGLDNRRENLRVATRAENARNQRRLHKDSRTTFKGITWDKDRKRWTAQIMVDGRRVFLGHHPDAMSAARAYDIAAVEMFGEFAATNSSLGRLPEEGDTHV